MEATQAAQVGQVVGDPVGQLTVDEATAMATLRQHGQAVTLEIGNLEIRKARLLGQMAEMEARAQGVLAGAGKRLGIADGVAWNVGGDGVVRLVAPVGGGS